MSVPTLDRGTAEWSPLERCTGDPRTFLRETWGQRATVRAGIEPAGFDDLLTLEGIDRFLTTMSPRTPYFRLVRSGARIAESEYTRSGRTGSRDVQGMADPARIAALFDEGATLVLQGLHRWSEPVTRFCRDLELELGHPCQVNAYITPPGAQGLDLHADPHDVFVLQAFGTKRWDVRPAPREPERPPLDREVSPGDTVYMPAGTPHAAASQDVVSGHLTVGVHVTPWRDVVREVSADALQALDGDVPAGWLDDPSGFAEELATRLDILAAGLRAVDVRGVADRRTERFLSNRVQLARGTVAERAARLSIDDDSILYRRPDAICELRRRGDVLLVLLGDRKLLMPVRLEPAMLRIATSEDLAVRDLSPEITNPKSRRVLASRLVREGLLTTVRAS